MDEEELKTFEGFLAPTFTAFDDNEEKSLNFDQIETYARWLKYHKAVGVLVNSITGEGPILGKNERQLNAEAWSVVCKKYKLKLMIQIGGAPMPDVLDFARHASSLNANGVVCLPELFYKPKDVQQLVGYCKIVARNCSPIPFIYYHLPRYTGVQVDMSEFCALAEECIPNFAGIDYSHSDIALAAKCLAPNRMIILSDSRMLSSGLLLGFKTFCMTAFNMVPDELYDICDFMKSGQLNLARKEQKHLNNTIRERISMQKKGNWLKAMKQWFNDEIRKQYGVTFSPGRARKLGYPAFK
ncbi:N-acetylneuraminate lyase B [Zeugodacus cucurbitae]|uniref:N-acetylneuraminate lyase n=1 Tax=Zeugodacus cucurbitae TaxID=28588 RepID=A0A0A1X0W8_ZEUCU|nr:N-acetylneuraminate lyase B [Zeugodacus cucurbitae]